jgi:hypothetical protein
MYTTMTRKTRTRGTYVMGAGTPTRRTGTVGRVITAMGLALMLGFGPARAEAGQRIVDIVRFEGLAQAIQGNSGQYVFAGPTATVTLGVQDRLTGAASAPLGLTTGSHTADVGLCFLCCRGGTP